MLTLLKVVWTKRTPWTQFSKRDAAKLLHQPFKMQISTRDTARFVRNYQYKMGRVMRKGPGRHDTWFRVICIWNHLLKMAAVIGFSFKERFLRFQLLFPDFYHFHQVIWGMKWSKKLKPKNGQNMSSGPYSRDAAQISSPPHNFGRNLSRIILWYGLITNQFTSSHGQRREFLTRFNDKWFNLSLVLRF